MFNDYNGLGGGVARCCLVLLLFCGAGGCVASFWGHLLMAPKATPVRGNTTGRKILSSIDNAFTNPERVDHVLRLMHNARLTREETTQ